MARGPPVAHPCFSTLSLGVVVSDVSLYIPGVVIKSVCFVCFLLPFAQGGGLNVI